MNDSGIYPDWYIHQLLEPEDILITGKYKREPSKLAAIKEAAEKVKEIEDKYGKPLGNQENTDQC